MSVSTSGVLKAQRHLRKKNQTKKPNISIDKTPYGQIFLPLGGQHYSQRQDLTSSALMGDN